METVIAEYNATEAALSELKVRLVGVKYEIQTTAGMDLAKKDRRELVTLRTALEAKRKEIKAPALERCRLIDAEASRIALELSLLEKPIDEQIKEEETRKEAIRAEKAKQEQERIAKIQRNIALIKSSVDAAHNLTAAELVTGIVTIENLIINKDTYAEFATEAEFVRAETLNSLREIHTTKQAAEDLAEKLRTEREERERQEELHRQEREKALAEENERLRIEREKFEAEQAEAKRKQDEETARLAEERRQFEEEKAKQELAEKVNRDKESSKLRAEQEETARIQREKDAVERKIAEEKATAAEKERAETEKARRAEAKARKLAEAKMSSAVDALKSILAITQDNTRNETQALAEIAVLAEANI